MLQAPGCWILLRNFTHVSIWDVKMISPLLLEHNGCRESSWGLLVGWFPGIWPFSSGDSTFLHSMLTFESQKSWWPIFKHEAGSNDSDCKTSFCRVSKSTCSYGNGCRPLQHDVAVSADCPVDLLLHPHGWVYHISSKHTFFEYSASLNLLCTRSANPQILTFHLARIAGMVSFTLL